MLYTAICRTTRGLIWKGAVFHIILGAPASLALYKYHLYTSLSSSLSLPNTHLPPLCEPHGSHTQNQHKTNGSMAHAWQYIYTTSGLSLSLLLSVSNTHLPPLSEPHGLCTRNQHRTNGNTKMGGWFRTRDKNHRKSAMLEACFHEYAK